MYFVIKKHDTEFYYVDNSLKVKELNDKYELILSNQGNFNNNDYGTITSYINIMKKRLDEQNNDKYLAKENYDYFKVLEFYLDHQNFYTIEINNIDLYEILIQYDASIYKNIITYYDIQNSINRELSNILSFLQQPYFNYDITNLYKGIPNPYNIIENLYYSQILLCDDIIKVGELYEK